MTQPMTRAASSSGNNTSPHSPHGAATSRDIRRPSFAASTWLVARREVSMKLRSKAFLISTAVIMLAVLASIIVGALLGGMSHETKVATVGSATTLAEQFDNLAVQKVDSVDAAEQLVRDGDVDAAIVPAAEGSAVPVRIIALDDYPVTLVGEFSVAPDVQLLQEAPVNPGLRYFVAIGFGIIFFMSAMTFGMTIAQSVVEEKQTRIVEILMSAIPVRALMAGKVVGNSLLAFAQIAGILVLASVALSVTGQDSLLTELGPSLIWFVVFFVFGFVMLAALYAATASLVSRQEDVGNATSPVMMLVMLPYFLVIFFNDNPVVLAIMSYVPFSAPVGMPMRIFLGQAAWWELPLSLAVLLATTAVVIGLGSRIYSNSLLKVGGRVKLREALSTGD